MRKEYRIITGEMKGGTAIFDFGFPASVLGSRPSGKMITDTDAGTFVYLFEDGEDYTYLHLTQDVWPLMQQLTGGESDPVLACRDTDITLTGFTEELTMLVFNIEGNGNYGEAFVDAVEHVFAGTLNAME